MWPEDEGKEKESECESKMQVIKVNESKSKC